MIKSFSIITLTDSILSNIIYFYFLFVHLAALLCVCKYLLYWLFPISHMCVACIHNQRRVYIYICKPVCASQHWKLSIIHLRVIYIGPITQRVPGRNACMEMYYTTRLLWSFCSSCGYAAEKWTQNGTATWINDAKKLFTVTLYRCNPIVHDAILRKI